MARTLVIVLIAAVAGGGAVYAAMLYLDRNPVDVAVSVRSATPTTPAPELSPTNTPTPAPLPTDTPLPTATSHPTDTPTPPPTPTATPAPTPTPTAIPPTEREIVVNAFAECDGQYSGRDKDHRFRAANSAIEEGRQTVADVRALVERYCRGVFAELVVAAMVQPTSTPPRPTATIPLKPTVTPAALSAVAGSSLAALHPTQNTRWVSQMHPALRDTILGLAWVGDGLTESEKETVDELLYVAVRDVGIAKDLVDMPFMQTHETADKQALDGINRIIRDGLASNLTRTATYRSGITDEKTPLVAAAATTESGNAIAEYLDGGNLTLKTTQQSTERTDNLTISIVRLLGGANPNTKTTEMIQQAVELTEAFMDLPLPTDHVIVVFDNRAVWGGYFGTNHNFAIGIKQNADPGTDNYKADQLQNSLHHEVAHYWWHGNADWIDEGMADTIAATASLAQGMPVQAKPNRRKDCTARNLSEIGRSTRARTSQFYCNYYLGEKLFRELQDNMSADAFTAAAQNLYWTSRKKPSPRSRQQVRADIAEVRNVFSARSDIVEYHWSGDVNAPHRWDPDDSLTFTSHDAIEWKQKPTYSNGTVSFSGELRGHATLSARTLQDARKGGTSNFTINDSDGNYLGSVLPQLTGGRYWSLDSPGDVVAGEYELSGSEFSVQFQWPGGIGTYADKHITVWGFNNANRTPEYNTRADPLGQSTVR